MSKIKLSYNKVYNYIKGRSVGELILDAWCVALMGIFVVGFVALNYNVWILGNIPQF
jgi:hypothetical protein